MNQIKIILLIGRHEDPHIKKISNALSLLGENYEILDTISETDFFKILYREEGVSSYFQINTKKIFTEQIKSVWNSSSVKISVKNSLKKETYQFINQEWEEGINSLWYSISARWVNSPESIVSSHNKLQQLRKAKDIGLKIPKTLITNSAENAIEFFYDCHEQLIAKT